MTRYSIEPRNSIFVEGLIFLSFAKKVRKNIGINISKHLRSKYSQKRLDHDKQSAADALKTASKRVIQKTEKAIGVLAGSRITYKIFKISKLLHRIVQKQLHIKEKILHLIEQC